MLVSEESGFALSGSLDGSNRLFRTTRDMRIDLPVEVYINGDRMVAGLENGFAVVDARTVELKEPPTGLDTVVVKFSADVLPIGLAGGTPQRLDTVVLGSAVLSATTMPQQGPLTVTVVAR